MNKNFRSFISALNNLYPITQAAISAIQQYSTESHYHRGEILHGQEIHQLYFINKGVLRGFIPGDHKDITTWMSCENELILFSGAPSNGTGSQEMIEVLENCTLITLSSKDLTHLSDEYNDICQITRNIFLRHCNELKNRLSIIKQSNAEEKYNLFLQHYSHLANRVFLKYISSFLGITPETLSRVRARR